MKKVFTRILECCTVNNMLLESFKNRKSFSTSTKGEGRAKVWRQSTDVLHEFLADILAGLQFLFSSG